MEVLDGQLACFFSLNFLVCSAIAVDTGGLGVDSRTSQIKHGVAIVTIFPRSSIAGADPWRSDSTLIRGDRIPR